MDFNALHKQRKIVMIAALVGAISMFLPWVSFMGFSSNGLDGAGFLILLAFLGAGVLAYLGDQKKPMAKNNWLGCLGCGALILLIWLINFLRLPSGSTKVLGIGFWLCALSAAGVLVATFLFRDPSQDLKQSLSEMKKQVENKLDNDPNT